MSELTPLERGIVQFVESNGKTDGVGPNLRAICLKFGFDSEEIAQRHLSFLEQGGYLIRRALTVSNLVEIPLLGRICCGPSEEVIQEILSYIPVPREKLVGADISSIFALEARGDSMIGRQIAEGDYVVLDKCRTPRSGDVVAALIGNESTLKTFVREKGKAYLRAENPKYALISPAEETRIQGVMLLHISKLR